MIRGVDVSSVQGSMDWVSVAESGIQFAVLKCSQGNEAGVDGQFSANLANAPAAGVVIGAYHFGYPLPSQPGNPTRDPAAQAKLAFEKCQGLGSRPGDLLPALDLEWPAPQDWGKWGCTAQQIRAWGLAYLQAAEALWGCKPLLYSYPYFLQSIGIATEPGYAGYPLWMADYNRYQHGTPPDGASPVVPPPWTSWEMWQHAGGTMKLPNGTPCDFDVLNGSLQDIVRPASQPKLTQEEVRECLARAAPGAQELHENLERSRLEGYSLSMSMRLR